MGVRGQERWSSRERWGPSNTKRSRRGKAELAAKLMLQRPHHYREKERRMIASLGMSEYKALVDHDDRATAMEKYLGQPKQEIGLDGWPKK